jgi:hypothetical protein
MSGITEVRLYRNTVDEIPAEYINVTAAVLNSSTKNHATGINCPSTASPRSANCQAGLPTFLGGGHRCMWQDFGAAIDGEPND